MNKTIREASTYLLDLLPPDTDYFTSDDLLKLGMPDFIVERIQIDVADRLVSALAPPATEYLNLERPSAVAAWSRYVETVKDDAHLPRKHAADMIDRAVIETVEWIVAPRRRVVGWIFGPSLEVSIDTVYLRSHYVTVNRYLTDALIRYMERKGLNTITKNVASDVITTVDERYVSNFTPLNWAQLIDPLFQITHNTVASELIHDFFVDKGHGDRANLFPVSSVRIDRVQFIERLSVGKEVSIPLSDTVIETPDEPVAVAAVAHQPDTEPVDEPNADVQQTPIVVPIWQQYLNDAPDEATLVDWLKTDENVYIDSLFEGNEGAYYRTLADLEACSDWNEAQMCLKEWVRSTQIDLHNADLAMLVDQVQIYFSTNDS